MAFVQVGCAHGSLEKGMFIKPEVHYFVGDIPAGWRLVDFHDNDLALVSNDSPHTIAVNATCKEYEDATLEVLTHHLLIGFADRKLLDQQTRTLDGREGLFSHYSAKLDGVPTELELGVLKKDGCVYDFTYTSPPGRFDEKRSTFEELLRNFKTETRR